MPDRLLLLSHAGATLIMVGIMWSVQLAIYPQFRAVPPADFGLFVANHSARIVRLLAPFAPVELVLAMLVWVQRPEQVSGTLALGAGVVLAVAWIATGFWYAPIHGRLQTEGHNAALVERLIVTNWFRTGLWSLRGVLALMML